MLSPSCLVIPRLNSKVDLDFYNRVVQAWKSDDASSVYNSFFPMMYFIAKGQL